MIPAKYTVVLKTLIDDVNFTQKLNQALSKYPLYTKRSTETYIPSIVPTRDELNKKILNYYKYREIGFETPGRFLDELETAMMEIMPKYNQLLFSADQDYNILFNVDYTKTIERENEATNSNTSNNTGTDTINESESTSAESTSIGSNDSTITDSSETNATVNNNNKNIKSSTPQGNITAATIDSVDHADEMSFNKDTNSDNATTSGTSTTESESSLNGTNSIERTNEATNTKNATITDNGQNTENETISERTQGNFGVMATQDLIEKYRGLIINIEQDIINDERISELFMRVY